MSGQRFFTKTLAVTILFLMSFSGFTYAADSFDYSKIAAHPRLLMSEKEESSVRKAIKSNVELAAIHNQIIAKSDEILTMDVLTYNKIGKRLLAVSREAIRRMFYLSYSYRMTNDKKYLGRAERELNTVSKFDNWNPTHYLDVGEMTMAVAIGYDWLYDDLQDSTKANIREAIQKHAFETAKVEEYNKFKRVKSNWNQVCNAGLVYGALSIFESDKKQAKEIIEEALKTNPKSLEGYAPDGNYPEGAMYWSYGTSFEVMMIAALDSALGSDNGLSQSPGFLKSAEYMLFVNGPTGKRFNYSDCSTNQYSNIAQFWFAKKTNNPNLLYEEKKLMDAGVFLKKMEEERLLPAVMAFATTINFASIQPPTQQVWAGRGETPVVLVRTDWNNKSSQYLGAKAGSASTSHAHMDAGSFVYDADGLRWAMDFGLQSYITLESKGIDLWNLTQESPRWGIFRLSNFNHNTITINNKRHNMEGRALMVETFDTDTEKGAKFDLSDIFKGEINSAMRKVVLKDEKYLQVEDEISTNNKEALVRWTMVTPANVKIIDSSTIELTQKGKTKLLKVSSDFPFELKTWNSDDPGTEYDAKNKGTIMIGFESNVPANKRASYLVTLSN